mgnify:FL=1
MRTKKCNSVRVEVICSNLLILITKYGSFRMRIQLSSARRLVRREKRSLIGLTAAPKCLSPQPGARQTLRNGLAIGSTNGVEVMRCTRLGGPVHLGFEPAARAFQYTLVSVNQIRLIPRHHVSRPDSRLRLPCLSYFPCFSYFPFHLSPDYPLFPKARSVRSA